MIISKDKTQIINDQYVSAIYIAGEGTTIRCEMSNGKPWKRDKRKYECSGQMNFGDMQEVIP